MHLKSTSYTNEKQKIKKIKTKQNLYFDKGMFMFKCSYFVYLMCSYHTVKKNVRYKRRKKKKKNKKGRKKRMSIAVSNIKAHVNTYAIDVQIRIRFFFLC